MQTTWSRRSCKMYRDGNGCLFDGFGLVADRRVDDQSETGHERLAPVRVIFLFTTVKTYDVVRTTSRARTL